MQNCTHLLNGTSIRSHVGGSVSSCADGSDRLYLCVTTRPVENTDLVMWKGGVHKSTEWSAQIQRCGVHKSGKVEYTNPAMWSKQLQAIRVHII